MLKHHWRTVEYMYARGKGYARGEGDLEHDGDALDRNLNETQQAFEQKASDES